MGRLFVLFFLLPWALGLIQGVDPLLTRTLFWWTGHPLVYFWLLPAYISWYTMLPKQAGGKEEHRRCLGDRGIGREHLGTDGPRDAERLARIHDDASISLA